MKKTLSILVAGVMALTMLVGCGTGASSADTSSAVVSEKTTVDTIKENGSITMYTNAYFPPFEYFVGEEIKGVDVDIANAIAAELGVTLKVESVDFDTIVGAVKTGKCDFGAAGMSVTAERMESVDFSNKYVKTQQYMVVADTDNAKPDFESLAGVKVGVQLGTTGDIWVSDECKSAAELEAENDGILYNKKTEVVPYKNALNAALDLKNGKVGAVVIDELTAQNIVKANAGLKCYPLVYADGTTTEEEYAIAVAKGNEALLTVINGVLDKLMADGTISQGILDHTLSASAE